MDQGVSTLSEASGQAPHYLTAATAILFWRSLFKYNRVKFSLLEELVILLNTEQGMHPLSSEQMT